MTERLCLVDILQDPHFKAQNHRRRIISLSLLAEYAYLLAPGGRMYTITDVPDLAEWMKSKVAAHPSFRPLTQEELDADVAAGLLITSSEEGQKVERNAGQVKPASNISQTCSRSAHIQGLEQLPSMTNLLCQVSENVACCSLRILQGAHVNGCAPKMPHTSHLQ